MQGGPKPRVESAIPGLAVSGGIITGVVGLVGSIVALWNGLEVGAGLFLFGAAVAFGMLTNAFFRS